jgi:dephospho-CoA kinase
LIRRIGLTGGIGSGKSTAARLLQGLGAHLVDTDAISRELTAPGGAAIDALRQIFGAQAIAADGSLDRARMRARAFSDPATRAALEAVLHPMIGMRAEAAARLAPPQACTVFDVPLLVESGRWRDRVERVLVIDCPVAVQIERVLRRPGWTREAVESVIAQQATREQRRAAADAVIDNSEDRLAPLQAALGALWERWVTAGPVEQ